MKIKSFLSLACLFVMLAVKAQTLSPDFTTQGTEFWIAYAQNGESYYPYVKDVNPPSGKAYPSQDLKLWVRLVASEAATVTFTFTEANGNMGITPVQIAAGEVKTVKLTDLQKDAVYTPRALNYTEPNEGTSLKSVYINSTKPISAYTLSQGGSSADVTNLLPADHFGTAYYHISYTPYPGTGSGEGGLYEYRRYDAYLVVATQDGTNIYVNGSAKTTLNKGQVYYYYKHNTDLTGTYVTSDKPIAYFVANTGSQIPVGNTATEILYQQMLPINTWGTNFLIPVTHRKKDRVRIVASSDDTEVTFSDGTYMNGATGVTQNGNKVNLSKGKWFELELDNSTDDGIGTFVSANDNHPIAVCSYLVGSTYVGESNGVTAGDPAMAWIPSVEQAIPNTLIAPFDLNQSGDAANMTHYAIIIVPQGSESKTAVYRGNNTTAIQLPLENWKTNTDYSFYQLDISSNISASDAFYRIYNPDNLTVLAYGYGNSTSYYYLAGAGIRDLYPSFTVNEEHFQDMYGKVYCSTDFEFEATISSRKAGNNPDGFATGSLVWLLKKDNGAFQEEVAARDKMKWSKVLTPGTYEARMVVLDANDNTQIRETMFVVSLPTVSTNKDRICIGETVTLTSSEEGTWESLNPSVATVNGNTATGISVGSVSFKFTSVDDCSSITNPVSVHPLYSIWTGEINSDWDNVENWYPQAIPLKCTDVYIPGAEILYFPILTANSTNQCKDIYFLPGGELGQPQLLDYDNAHVQIDLGAGSRAQIEENDYVSFLNKGAEIDSQDRLKLGAGFSSGALGRSRFHMLSASLKSVATGDMAFGGYPFTYIRKFDPSATKEDGTSFIAGRWSEFYSSLTEEFQPGEGFVYWVNEYKQGVMRYLDNNEWPVTSPAGMTTQPSGLLTQTFGLAEINGILHLPFYDDLYMSAVRRNHLLVENNTSKFYYFWQAPLNDPNFMQFTGNSDPFPRENATRFISEHIVDGQRTLDFEYNAGSLQGESNGETLLIGNPYMSALDIEQFYYHNYMTVKDQVQVWDGEKFVILGPPYDKITPMQSFIVELNEDLTGDIKIEFNSAAMATTTSLNTNPIKPFKGSAHTNRLVVKAVNEEGETSAYIIKNDEARDNFCNKDISKIIEYPVRRDLPEVYSLTPVKDSNTQRALVYNSIKSDHITIPLGIATAYSGDMKLELTGMENYNATIMFIDIEGTPSEIDITGMSQFEYPFTISTDESNVNENRFLISLSPKETTGMEDVGQESIKSYVYDNDIMVVSSSDDKIKQVTIYDVQGRTLYQQKAINQSLHKAEGIAQSSGIYLVKIWSENGTKAIKVVK